MYSRAMSSAVSRSSVRLIAAHPPKAAMRSARKARLKARTPSQAIFAPEGCGLTTIVFPAATMLTTLPASVGSEWEHIAAALSEVTRH